MASQLALHHVAGVDAQRHPAVNTVGDSGGVFGRDTAAALEDTNEQAAMEEELLACLGLAAATAFIVVGQSHRLYGLEVDR